MTVAACPCGKLLGGRYGADQVCWRCWQIAHGGDGTAREPDVRDDNDPVPRWMLPPAPPRLPLADDRDAVRRLLEAEAVDRANGAAYTLATPTEPVPERPADPDWMQFRRKIIRRLVAVDRPGFHYIHADRIVGTCPACKAGPPEYLVVTFHGRAPQADLECSHGCDERDIARRLAK